MHASLLLGLLPLAAAQVSQVHEAPPPPPVLLTTTKSGVAPTLPTPFNGTLTLQGAVIMPLPPMPGYVGLNGTATAQTSMPTATYRATLPPTMFNNLVGTNITGYIEGVGSSSGVRFTVNLQNLPTQAQYGPFAWHIHNLPVPANGNCTATTGHFDPTNRGELYMCDASKPETCQAGDLAGKHGGKIMTANTFSTSFVEPYLSTQSGSAYFFGGLSFLLHSSNTTRLTCANFVQVNGSSMAPNSTAPGTPQFTGAAGKVAAGVGAFGAAVVAALL
jgi:Cu/Zn superoxide dismutase